MSAPSVTPVLSSRALNRATLARQMLLERSSASPLEMIENLVGLQAQAPFSPYYGLWSRLTNFTPDGLPELLLSREVVRIVLMRGTIHLVSINDALMLRPLFAALMERGLLSNTLHANGIKGLDLAELASAARPILEHQPLTMPELGAALDKKLPGYNPDAMAYGARCVLPLVQVPPRAIWGQSGQTRVTTLESWVGRPLETNPSLEAMVLRYLAAFGPASVADIQTWSGLTRLKEIVERLRSDLRTFRNEDGKELFDLPDAPRPDPDPPAPIRFLPEFDNILRSHADRRRVISDDQRKLMATKNGMPPHSVLVDGFFGGTWKIVPSRDDLILSITPVSRLSEEQHVELEEEGMQLLSFGSSDHFERHVEIRKINA